MIYELRIYTVNEGKMDLLLDRFRNHTLFFFNKYNMHVVNFYCNKNRDKLFYILQFENIEEKNIAWNAFLADAGWKRVSEQTNKDGRLVNNIESHLLYPINF